MVKLGVIGCGAIAERMLGAWRPHMRDAEIIALTDVNRDRADLFCKMFPTARGFSEFEALLAMPGLDAVLILTPNFLHASQTIAATHAGKHVLCQKPLAMNAEEARTMVASAQEAGVTLMAAFAKRFWPYYATTKAMVERGDVGKVLSIRSQFTHSGIGKYYVPASNWFGDRDKVGGGALVDLGVHHLDIMRWIVGAEVETVSAEITRSGGDTSGLEDNAIVNLQFEGGVIGQGYYGFTTIAPPGVSIERVEVYGTTGSIIVNLSHPARAVVQYCSDQGDLGRLGGWVDVPVADPQPAFSLMLQHFVDSLRRKEAPLTTGVDGLAAVAVVEAAYQSASAGRRIAIPGVRS
jgi:UDP-N-acetylglucosamine 3-dehydrogenase